VPSTQQLALSDLEKRFFLHCRPYPDFGSYLFTSSKRFVEECGVRALLVEFPELFELKGSKSARATVGEFLSTLIAHYVEHRVGSLMKRFHKLSNPAEKEQWDYSAKLRYQTFVSALHYFAPQLRELDPGFTPPDADLATVYNIWFHIGGPVLFGLSHVYAHITKEDVLRWAQARWSRVSHQLGAEQVRQALLSHLASRERGSDLDSSASYTYTLVERDECTADLEGAVAAVLGNAPTAAAEIQVPREGFDEEEQARFEFEIAIIGCQSEACTNRVEVILSREELLAWAQARAFSSPAYIEGLLLDYLVQERGTAHLDDHHHEFELTFDGQEQLDRMVELVTRQVC
jgi:hypothetical protein